MEVISRVPRLVTTTLTLTAAALLLLVGCAECSAEPVEVSTEEFAREVERALPQQELYDYHKRLSEDPVHVPARNPDATPRSGELALPARGWKLIWNQSSTAVLQNAVQDFQDCLNTSMQVQVDVEGRDSLEDWESLNSSIVVGTRDQLPGCGAALEGPKDYEIVVTPERVIVCGYDERGAMYGLYNLEARMNLRKAPFLPSNLNTLRHSLYDARMVQSWMGWMEFPDQLLAHMAHDGFDAIFASVLANPNGDRTTAESSTDFYARILYRMRQQDPARMRDLIDRAARFGIKVYTPINYQYLGTPESEAGLRQLVRDILTEFPDIQGYVLLTEGFWYKQWGGGHGASEEYMHDWAQNWSHAVSIVAEECHRVNPAIEILPWEYNIDFRPQNVEMKRYFIQQLPEDTIPLVTWENGKSFEIDGLQGHLRDYAISQVGPAEVTQAQIAEARQRGMKVYTNADTFLCGAQLQTVPYHPFPYQWHERYQALEKYGVNGALESWSSGYTPSFMTELRAWYCWSDAPPLEELLGAIAVRNFGTEGTEMVLEAWEHFSHAIRLVPDTGPTMGTSNAIGNPLFFQEPPARTATFKYSWTDHEKWMGYMGGEINPYWPFTVSRLVFYPDFTNQTNRAESYARSVSGIESAQDQRVLPVFLKYLQLASDRMEEGLKLYRAAALQSPAAKREQALKEVLVAEQIQRMLQSNHAILEFYIKGDSNHLLRSIPAPCYRLPMARQARIVVPGVAHHVSQRGNYRQDVFFTDDDRRVYLSFLRESARRHGLAVSAYCLMTNHVHLVATPDREESLAKTMGRTHLMYAQYIHRLHGRLGHLWQSRFYSCPMDEDYAHNAAAYVELNPVRAGMAASAWDYAWSSAAAHCGERGDPARLLDLGAWFEELPASEWKATLTAIADSGPEVDLLRLHTRTGRPLGRDSFLSKVETYLGRRVRAIPRGRPYGSKDRVRRKRR